MVFNCKKKGHTVSVELPPRTLQVVPWSFDLLPNLPITINAQCIGCDQGSLCCRPALLAYMIATSLQRTKRMLSAVSIKILTGIFVQDLIGTLVDHMTCCLE